MNDVHHCQELFVVASDFVEKSPRPPARPPVGDRKIAKSVLHPVQSQKVSLPSWQLPKAGGIVPIGPLARPTCKGEIR